LGKGYPLVKQEDRIVRDANICGGEFFGALGLRFGQCWPAWRLAIPSKKFDAAFPALKTEDVQAAIAFAAASEEEDLPVPATPHIR